MKARLFRIIVAAVWQNGELQKKKKKGVGCRFRVDLAWIGELGYTNIGGARDSIVDRV